jgi:hypothetical protein
MLTIFRGTLGKSSPITLPCSLKFFPQDLPCPADAHEKGVNA